jgi:hypothetical protein
MTRQEKRHEPRAVPGRPRLPRCTIAWAVLALSLITTPAAVASQAGSAVGSRYARVGQVCPPPTPGDATCFAVVRVPVASSAPASTRASPYIVGDGAAASGPAGGLTPADLASAYGYDPASGGSAQTVAVVDAYDDPNIEKDLAVFDGQYGLAPCTKADGCLTKVGQTGSEASLPAADSSGWSVEITLDVETVHSVCPNCRILLVEANHASNLDLAAAVNEAAALGATEISNSYGEEEGGFGATERAAYNHPGVVIAAASGDDGYDGWDLIDTGSEEGLQMPNTPSSLPTVVGVGGTTLELNSDGTRAKETVWNDDGPGDESGFLPGFVSGGGCSTLSVAEPWQRNTPGYAASGCEGKRLDNDVAAVADPYTGFDVYDSYNCGSSCEEYGIGKAKGKGWLTLGGTSLATPMISSLYALAGGSDGVRYPAQTLYEHVGEGSALYDITERGNGFCDAEPLTTCGNPNAVFGRVDCKGTTACNAAPGYDGPSGVGAPNGLGAFRSTAKQAQEEQEAASVRQHEAEAKKKQEEETAAAVNKQEVKPPATTNLQDVSAFRSSKAPAVPDVRLASTAFLAGASGNVTVKVSCPAGETTCAGTVTLRTLYAVNASAAGSSKKKPAILTLAAGSFTVPGGKVKTIILHLSGRARALLARLHVLRVRVVILAHDPAGATHRAEAIATLRPRATPRAKG